MNDPILLLLTTDIIALLLLGTGAAVLPPTVCSFIATMLSGLGMLLCLPPLLLRAAATTLDLPLGPPSLLLHVGLDPLSAFFLIVVFLAGTALAAFQSTTSPSPDAGLVRTTSFCLAGTTLSVLAADGVTLALGLAVMCGAIWLGQPRPRYPFVLLIPFFVLAAVCLLTPTGFAPGFDAIRAAPVDPAHATAAAALTLAAIMGLTWSSPEQRCWTRAVLTAGMLIPFGSYLLLRLMADLAGITALAGSGFVLLLAGGATAIVQGWHAASHPDIDGSVLRLARRQAGLAMASVGLALIARSADLPGAEAFALSACFLSVIGSGVAGVLTALAAHSIGTQAGTHRLSRLGGLVHSMPAASAALAAGLLGLSALPPGLGFASLWLLFEGILSAPRTGGLLFQLPLALIGAAIALSAALATAASVRLIGVALLGRPRTPQEAGEAGHKPPAQTTLLMLAGLSTALGILPGAVLWALADPAILALSGAPPGARIGLALLVPSLTSPSYLAIPVLALLALATGAATLVPRWWRKESKAVGLWADGMAPTPELPFGEPAAQSAGEGFLPVLPYLPHLRFPPFTMPRAPRVPSAFVGLWVLLVAFGILLLLLAMTA